MSAAKCPAIRSFPRFLALREMRRRPRTYQPMFCIYFGVMLLLFNLFIYTESRIQSDILYYKVNTQWILPELTDAEITVLRAEEDVQAVEAVADGYGTYTAYVTLTPDKDHSVHEICRSLCDTLTRMQLWERSAVYKNAKRISDERGVDHLYNGALVNARYLIALSESLFQPSMLLLSLLSAGMVFAVTVFLYRMKLAQSAKEYAVLRGMGMTMRTLRRIQFGQANAILTLSFFPSLGLSVGIMAWICHLTTWLFPDYHGNTVLRLAIPWATIVFLWAVWSLAVFLAIFLCTRMFRQKTVTELSRGAAEEISYVEKSDGRFLSGGGLSRYETLWRRRNRKKLMRTAVLCLLLVLFPGLIFSIFLTMHMTAGGWMRLPLAENETYVYQLRGEKEGIPARLLEDLAALPGVSRLHSSSFSFLPENTDMCPGSAVVQTGGMAYPALCIHTVSAMRDMPSADAVWVGADFPGNSGDMIRLSVDGYGTAEAVIEKKDETLAGRENQFRGYEYAVFIGSDVYCSLYGTTAPRFHGYVNVIADTTVQSPEDTVAEIERYLGYDRVYQNEHERYLHDRMERPYTVQNVYYESRIVEIKDTFFELFILTQTFYLLLCAAAVIASVTCFDLSRRESEFATLRAMGVEKTVLRGRITGFGCIPIARFLPILYPLFVFFSCLMDDNVGFARKSFSNALYFKGTELLVNYLIGEFAAVVLLAVLYLGAAYLAGRRTGKTILGRSLIESIRGDGR